MTELVKVKLTYRRTGASAEFAVAPEKVGEISDIVIRCLVIGK